MEQKLEKLVAELKSLAEQQAEMAASLEKIQRLLDELQIELSANVSRPVE